MYIAHLWNLESVIHVNFIYNASKDKDIENICMEFKVGREVGCLEMRIDIYTALYI